MNQQDGIDWSKRAEDALDDLIKTDRKLAELRVKWERDKRKAKNIWSALYLRSQQKNVEARKSEAETTPQYETAVAAEMTSLLEYEALRNARHTNELVIDFWRSWQKAKTEGQI